MNFSTEYSVEDLLAVANTRHGAGAHRNPSKLTNDVAHDHLLRGGDAVPFLRDHGVTVPAAMPTAHQLDRLRTIRQVVEEQHAGKDVGERLEQLLKSAAFRLGQDGRLSATGSGWNAVTANLLPPLLELVADPNNLKRCSNPSCRWLFIDRSRNRSRRWCEMAVCGNRAKAGRWRDSRDGSGREQAADD